MVRACPGILIQDASQHILSSNRDSQGEDLIYFMRNCTNVALFLSILNLIMIDKIVITTKENMSIFLGMLGEKNFWEIKEFILCYALNEFIHTKSEPQVFEQNR